MSIVQGADLTRERPFLDGSAQMRAIGTVIASIADTDTTVLIRGESGVGKDLVARTIHAVSSRRRGAFVKVNCAAIPPGLLESEFFGHEKGAFTGAHRRTPGQFCRSPRACARSRAAARARPSGFSWSVTNATQQDRRVRLDAAFSLTRRFRQPAARYREAAILWDNCVRYDGLT